MKKIGRKKYDLEKQTRSKTRLPCHKQDNEQAPQALFIPTGAHLWQSSRCARSCPLESTSGFDSNLVSIDLWGEPFATYCYGGTCYQY